jgi:hypothetical protein
VFLLHGSLSIGPEECTKAVCLFVGCFEYFYEFGTFSLTGVFFFFFFLSFGASLTLLLVFGLFVEFFWGSG